MRATLVPPGRARWSGAAVSALAAVCASVGSAAAASNLEHEPLRYGPNSAGTAVVHGSPAPVPVGGAADVVHVALALAVVIGLIFALRWAARKMSLVPGGSGGGRAVQVLNRTPIAPKQQILLLRVGSRVLVVADSASAGMQMLTEFTDADEVAALIGEARSTAAGPQAGGALSGKSFASLFSRASEPFAGGGPTPPTGVEPPVPGEVAGLLDKVRGLRQQFEA